MAPDKGATRSVVGWFWLCAFFLSVLCVLCRAREGGMGWESDCVSESKGEKADSEGGRRGRGEK